MGCDIHVFRERKVNSVWESDSQVEVEDDYTYVSSVVGYVSRDYFLFGLLSNVRIENPIPSIKSPLVTPGFPSDLTEIHNQLKSDDDLHTPGHISIQKLLDVIPEVEKSKTLALLSNKGFSIQRIDNLIYSINELVNQAKFGDYFAGCNLETEARLIIAYDS